MQWGFFFFFFYTSFISLSIWPHQALVAVYGIQFPDQGSNLSPCTGSMESQPLNHQGSPYSLFALSLKQFDSDVQYFYHVDLIFSCHIFFTQGEITLCPQGRSDLRWIAVGSQVVTVYNVLPLYCHRLTLMKEITLNSFKLPSF